MNRLFTRSLLSAFLLFHTGLLHGQQSPDRPAFPAFPALPPGGPLPGSVPFPSGLSAFGDSSLLGMRSMPPDRALVKTKTVSTNAFTLVLQFGNSTRSFSQVGATEETMKVVNHLVEGRTYDFPKVFDDVLGKLPPPWPAVAKGEAPYPFGLEKSGRKMPFRARLLKKDSSGGVISLELHCADGPRLTLSHSSPEQMKEALRCAERLKEGQVYEFPDALRASAAAGRTKPAPPSAEMQLLAPFVGEWEGPMTGQRDVKMTVRYLWKGDGQGMWKEVKAVTAQGSTMQETAWLITYDASRKCYLETPTRPDTQAPVVEMRWDAASQTLNLLDGSDRREPDMLVGGSRRLTTPDRMDWRFTKTNLDGRIVYDNAGSYTRVKAGE